MAIEHTCKTYRGTLEDIANLAQGLKHSSQSVGCTISSSTPLLLETPPHTLTLPIPNGITPSLLSTVSCSPLVSQRFSDAFIRMAYQLRAAQQKAYLELLPLLKFNSNALPEWMSNPQTFLESRYRDQLRIAEEQIVDQIRKSRERPVSHLPKKPFNQEFVPLLEKYFEQNAYPSAADRAALAKKSTMTARQIEVWFQNHRNRAKKEGVSLRRIIPGSLPNNSKSREDQTPYSLPSEQGRLLPATALHTKPLQREVSGRRPQNQSSQDKLIISSIAPLHAFPTVYPPKACGYDPFPVKNGCYTFPAPVWMRRPSTNCCYTRTPIDLEGLIQDFNKKLVLRPTSSRNRNTTHHPPWYSATVNKLPSAPHPALVQSRPSASNTSSVSLPKASASKQHRVFCYPSPPPEPIRSKSNQQPIDSNDTCSRKRTSRIVKRIPKDTSFRSHRNANRFPSSESKKPTSSFQPSSPSLRLSSLGSTTLISSPLFV